MKIHYTTPSWHGGFQKFFGDALRSSGHDVVYFDDSGAGGQKLFRHVFTRVPGWQYGADNKFREAVSRDWLESVRKSNPDLVVIEHAPNILSDVIREAKSDGHKVFYWLDSPPAGSQAKDVLAAVLEADKVFSIDKRWMTMLYAPNDFVHLPLAGDPGTFHPISGMNKEYDIVFVGSFPPATGDGFLRAKTLADIPDKYRVAVFGNGVGYWIKHFPKLKNRVMASSTLPAEKLNEIYNKTKIFLNIHSTWHATSISARVYEVALAGTFQIVDWREDLDALFPQGSFASFHYAKEINVLISEWVNKSEECEKRAGEIRDAVLHEHTWKHRAEKMLSYFK